MPGASPTELTEIDAFLRDAKSLSGPPPQWVPSTYRGKLQATWLILDSLKIQSGALRFSCRTDGAEPSLSIVLRDRLIWRTDIVDPTVCKPNPIGARILRLPATVCGSHHHSWWDNRSYVEQFGFGRLPYRRPLPPQVRRLNQAIPALAQEIEITLDDGQRGFDVPPAVDLLGIFG